MTQKERMISDPQLKAGYWEARYRLLKAMSAKREQKLLEALETLAKYYIEQPVLPEHFKESDEFQEAVLKRNKILDKAEAAIKKAKGE